MTYSVLVRYTCPANFSIKAEFDQNITSYNANGIMPGWSQNLFRPGNKGTRPAKLPYYGKRVRIWRICFEWRKDGVYEVEIVDYH